MEFLSDRVNQLYAEQGIGGAAADKLASRLEGISGTNNLVTVLQSHTAFDRDPEAWDPDDHILNTVEGVVDLRSGELQPHDRGLMCSMCTSVGPAPGEPVRWLQFIEEITQGDPGLAQYLQILAGYCLFGGNPEEIVNFFTGPGGNGKSTFTETLAFVMGEYAATLSPPGSSPRAMVDPVEGRTPHRPLPRCEGSGWLSHQSPVQRVIGMRSRSRPGVEGSGSPHVLSMGPPSSSTPSSQ
jgi:hypothetical protein